MLQGFRISAEGIEVKFVGYVPASLAVGHNPIWGRVTECVDCEKFDISKRFLFFNLVFLQDRVSLLLVPVLDLTQ